MCFGLEIYYPTYYFMVKKIFIFSDLCPTEADLQEIIGAVEEPSTKGSVRFGTFVRLVWFIKIWGIYIMYSLS